MPQDPTKRFFQKLAGGDHLGLVFDHLPQPIGFFVKDDKFRLIAINDSMRRRINIGDLGDILGKDDFEIFPEAMAEHFRRDDTEVFRSGQPVRGIVEPFFDEQGLPDWCVTDKFPLRDEAGQVIGLMGVTQHYDQVGQALSPNPYLRRSLTYIREHYCEEITLDQLAGVARISKRQLSRTFTEHLGLSPLKFIIKTRVLAACQLLRETETPVVEIASRLGFCDQSALTRHFRAEMGVPPLSYRRAKPLGNPTP